MARLSSCILACVVLAVRCLEAQGEKITIAFQTYGSVGWPLFIAQEGGYYRREGLDVKLVMAGFPGGVAMLVSNEAQMTIGGLQQLLPAAAKDDSLVAVGSWMNRSTFSLMARPRIASVEQLKGKRIAVAQIGDSVYGYVLAVLAKHGLSRQDVELIPVGPDFNQRAAALASGRADATLLPAPAMFRLEAAGYKRLADLADYDSVYTSAAYWVKKSTLRQGMLVERIVRAHTEAIQRFYRDRDFAIKAYLAHDKGDPVELQRTYDLLAQKSIFERIPYVQAGAVISAVDQQADPKASTLLKPELLRHAIDNSLTDRLMEQGVFEEIFGSAVRKEEQRIRAAAFR